jgi:hypothetical protein
MEHSTRIEQTLGDTLAHSLTKLTTPATTSEVDKLLDDTWRKDGYTFTKENYLPFHLEAFSQFFEVVILLREFENTFPPRRHRVMQWYEHFCYAIYSAGQLDAKSRLLCTSSRARAAVGYYWMVRQYLHFSKQCGIPVLWWGDLNGSCIPQKSWLPLNVSDVVSSTKAERISCSEQYDIYWQDAFTVFAKLQKIHGVLKCPNS